MKGKLLIAALLTACCAAASEAALVMTALSSSTFNSGGQDKAYAIAAAADGSIYITGTRGNNYYTQKYTNALGQTGASQEYSNGRGSNIAKGIALDGLGNVIVVGEENNGTDLDFLTLKYSPNLGVLLSSVVYNGSDFDSAAAVATDGNSNIFVAGYTNDAGIPSFHTIKYSPQLNSLSTATYSLGNENKASALAIDSNNNIIVAGYTKTGTSGFLVFKYDNNLNVLRQAPSFDGGGDAAATGVAVDSANNIIVTGRVTIAANNNYCTVKYDSSLRFISSATYEGAGSDIPSGVTVDSNDNIIVTGMSNTGTNDYFTIKYDRGLNVISTGTYDGTGADLGNAVTVDAFDNVFVTGQSFYLADNNYFSIKYNASPKITAVGALYIGQTVPVDITGMGFLADSAVSFEDTKISSGATLTWTSGQQVTLDVSPSTSVLLGVTTVTVTNANGEAVTYYQAETWISTTVTTAQPETINATMKLGQIRVTIPAGSFLANEVVTIHREPIIPGDLLQVGDALSFTGPSSTSTVVGREISIKLRYSVADLGGYPESGLSLAYWDSAVGWVRMTSSVNTSEKSVTGTTRAVGPKFAVVKEAQGSGDGTGGGGGGAGGSGIPAKVYPNPYRPGSGGSFDQSTKGAGIVFAGIGAGVAFKLTIVDLAGQLVFQKSAAADSTGSYLWDTKTVTGGDAATGVYIYMITGGAEPKKGKFSIIR